MERVLPELRCLSRLMALTPVPGRDASKRDDDTIVYLPCGGAAPSSALASCGVLLPAFLRRVTYLPRFYQLSFSQLMVGISFEGVSYVQMPCCSPHITFLSALPSRP